MSVLLMLVLPLPIGWFIRARLTAYVAYVAAFSVVFTFQSTMLITEWAGGSKRAFGGFPKANMGDVWSYGVVNLGFLVVGSGLLTLAARFASRRRERQTVARRAVAVAA